MDRSDVKSIQSDPDYKLVLELDFDEMIPFVLKEIRKRGIMSTLYFLANLIMILAIVLMIILGLSSQDLGWRSVLWHFLGGFFCGSMLVIPVHELLHGLAYRMLGARKIIFGAELKQLIFYVTADRYIISGKQTVFLALFPFLIINLFLLGITFLLFPDLKVFSCAFLLSHNLMCIGDFAIANYVLSSGKNLYSFDEPEKRKNYFFEKMEPGL